MDKVRVGFWSPLLFEVGGTETWHRTLWGHLDPERIENCGMAVLDEEQFRESTAERLRPMAPVCVGKTSLPRLAEHVDVLVVWGIANPHHYLFYGGYRRPKIVFVAHGCHNSRWTRSVVKSAAESGVVDQFVGVSKEALKAIHAVGAEGRVIYNGVDFDELEPEFVAPARSDGVKTLGYVGRLSEEKRPDVFVDTIASLPEHWRGLMVGKDYLDGRIQIRANMMCPGRITFAGWTTDMGAAYAQMDALLVPSATEGFGYQIAEAWAREVPVVATPVGIAAEHPLLVRTIPYLPTGNQAARGVLADEADVFGTRRRAILAKIAAERFYSAARFGQTWSDFLWTIANEPTSRAGSASPGDHSQSRTLSPA